MELMVFLPVMLLAYFPMKQYLRLRPARLAAASVSLILLLSLAGDAVRRCFNINILWPPSRAVSMCIRLRSHAGNPSVFSLLYAAFLPASETPPSG